MTPSRPATPPPLPRLLIVDDDPGQRHLLESFLAGQGFPVQTAAQADEALARLAAGDSIAMVVSDVRMPGMSGLEMLRHIRASHPRLPVLLVTAYADVRDAVEAMRDGAVNYLEKPIDLDELLSSVRFSLGLAAPSAGDGASSSAPASTDLRGFICESAAMRDVAREAAAVAPTDSRVLITGESGVGKDAVADLIHRLSPRAERPIARLKCAGTPADQIDGDLFGIEPGAFDDTTIPDVGMLEHAQGGTIVLDEIGELPLPTQAKILRLIESGVYRRVGATLDRRADVRILATTKGDLEALVESERLRRDLYYRICVFGIHVPTLAERRDDVLPLANHFLECSGVKRPRFSPTSLVCMETYNWPGNVRELRNAMERAALLARGDVILPEHLPRRVRETAPAPPAPDAGDVSSTMDDIERSVILQTLRENRFNRSETARRLGISRRALIYKLRRFREQGFSIEPGE